MPTACFWLIVRRDVTHGIFQQLPAAREERLLQAIRERIRLAVANECSDIHFDIRLSAREDIEVWPTVDVWPEKL